MGWGLRLGVRLTLCVLRDDRVRHLDYACALLVLAVLQHIVHHVRAPSDSRLLPPTHPADVDFAEYNSMLRNGILEAFSGIIQGMGQAKADQYLKAQVRFEFEFETRMLILSH